VRGIAAFDSAVDSLFAPDSVRKRIASGILCLRRWGSARKSENQNACGGERNVLDRVQHRPAPVFDVNIASDLFRRLALSLFYSEVCDFLCVEDGANIVVF
jgi:hypothetical protein